MSTATSSAPAKHEARLALSPTLASPGSFDLDVTECVNRTAPQASVTPPHPRSQCSLRGEAATACPVRSSMGMYDVLAQHLIPDGAPAPVPEHLTAWPLSFPLFISASFVWATD